MSFYLMCKNSTAYREFSDPFNLAQQIGTYEVIKTASSHKNVIRQMVTEFPCKWCIAETLNLSMNIIGNASWYDDISHGMHGQ